MTNKIVINVAEPVGAANVPAALENIANLPEVTGVVARGLTVTVTFAEELTTDKATEVQAYGLTLPLVARIIRYTKVASEDCGDAIVGGIWCDVTGTNRFYDSDKEAQLNLVGAVVSQTDTYWHCKEFLEGNKEAILHTPAQLIGLGQAIKTWKDERIYVFQTFRVMLNACTTTGQCDALMNTWDPMATPVYPT